MNIDPLHGLSNEEVNARIQDKKRNFDTIVKSKSILAIIRTNLFTLFNLINFFLVTILVLVGSYEDTVFIMVAVVNIIIGTVNEIRAKRIIDKLSLLVANKANVIRDGRSSEIGIYDIVLDDIIQYEAGNQVPVDSKLLSGEIEVNQSFITGEETPVYKKAGDTILSGSFIISGNSTCQVIAIGHDNYTSKISSDAAYLKDTNSEILLSLRNVIKFVTLIIIPFGIFTFIKQFSFNHVAINEAVIGTVAALDGMIPNGLILLTSTVMAVGVIRLQRYKVLVQELYSIENLARVDIVCLDKTGTLTEGKMEVHEAIPYGNHNIDEIKKIIVNICSNTKDKNATSTALLNAFKGESNWSSKQVIPFSSKRKYSGVSFEDKGTYLIGAPEYLVKEHIPELEVYAEKYRVLALVHTYEYLGMDEINDNLEVIGFILLQDKIRLQAKDTLKYFDNEKIKVAIISGDSLTTIANIAERLEIDNVRAIDMTDINDDFEMREIVKEYNVFGRVSPEQKKSLILHLQSIGHSVAMVGDGVNDVLALKEADCSVAMASGSDAARNVSQLILLDSNFDALPKVLLEGRRAINNIGKTSALFLSKTMYSIIIVLMFLFLPFAYPFTPLQLTLVSTLTIGIPSFFLGLQYNSNLVKSGFLRHVFKRIVPISVTMSLYVLVIAITKWVFNGSEGMLATLCILMAATTGFMLLYRVSQPLNTPRAILLLSMISIFIICVVFFPGILSISPLNTGIVLYYIPSFIGVLGIFKASEYLVNKRM